jgi:uncharacterized phage protein gp47/JayE
VSYTVLPTLAATVTSTGITAPTLAQILSSLQGSYTAIYGTDTVLDPSTQDGQWLGILAQAIYDCNQTAIAVYNQFSPATAVGAGLSSVVKINGIAREASSNSTVELLLTGTVGKIINNGTVGDDLNLGTAWALPSSVTITTAGTIAVTGTCTVPGAVTAAPGTLTDILTPTAGWDSVTNPAAAAPGAPVETDSALRQRQAQSTALAAEAIIDGMVGAVLDLPNVTACVPYVNSTGTTDANGLPAHSFCLVVEGGDLQSIVNTIGLKKAPGPTSYGNTSGTYVSQFGQVETISFTIPAQETIDVGVTLTPLTGYTTIIGTEIQAAVAAYVESLGSGSTIRLNRLNVPANLAGPYAAPATPNDALTYEITTIEAAISPNALGTVDISLTIAQAPVCLPANVTIVT